MGYFGDLNGDLVAIKELCENIKAKYEGKPTPNGIWKDYELYNEKGTVIQDYSPSGIPIVRILSELGPKPLKSMEKGFTYFSYKELFKLVPKIPEILSSLKEHRTKIMPKINEINKLYDEIEEEHNIAKQAIIQYAISN